MNQFSSSFDIAIVGGGLAGLTAALYAARAGHAVVLFEKDSHGGGRATTHVAQGFHLNQGPHALYAGGHGIGILRELGIHYTGQTASYEGSWMLRHGEKFPMPGTPLQLAATGLLSAGAKLEAASLFASMPRLAQDADARWTVREWLDQKIQHADLRSMFEGLIRLSTYCDEATAQNAKAALTQTAMGRQGVEYLDHGWQTLVDRLREAIEAEGVRVEMRAPVARIRADEDGATVVLAGGETINARCVISTASPAATARLVNNGAIPSLRQAADGAIPIHAACLDVALKRLPDAAHQFAIGLDRPWYYSVHTRSAKLAPDGGAVIQVAKYLNQQAAESAASVQKELEGILDWLQPGWRNELVEKRFLPRMLVANAVVTSFHEEGHGRPGPATPELPTLFLAGDWVGAHGMLVDASLASARDAARLAGERLRGAAAGAKKQRQVLELAQN